MLRAIIVDDEERARNGLKKMIANYCEGVEVIGLADSVATAVKVIKRSQPDIVFLDIDFPEGDGFDLLESLGTIDFEIIFATAYDKFAIKAFKYSALDYLVKPIDLEELNKAVERAKQKNKHERQKQYDALKNNLKANKFEKIAVPTSVGLLFLEIKNIIRLQADGNYTHFHLINGEKQMISHTLREYEDLLSDNNFFRVHTSHLVNLNKIKKYVQGRGGYLVMEDGSSVEVSARKKNDFLALFKPHCQ